MKKILVIIPTYNEVENIENLVRAILKTTPMVHILVVDDNSPDKTGQKVEELINEFSQLHLLKRAGKEGLGKAYLAGFQWGLDKGFDLLIEMDADFSHRPEDLKKIVEVSDQYDFVIGSRYVPGGKVENWGILRKLISRGGSLYSRWILGLPLNDLTGGFNAWSRDVLLKMGIHNVRSEGYCFQIELKYRAVKLGFRGIEVSIVFKDRVLGQSKMTLDIVLEALYKVWQIRFIKI